MPRTYPFAEYRDAPSYADTPIAVSCSPGDAVYLLTLDAARDLWRQLGKACTDVDSANARATLATRDDEYECVSEDCEGYGWLVDPGT